jgi:hypothetical protein
MFLLGYNFFIKIKALIVIILTISALVLNDDEKQKKLR